MQTHGEEPKQLCTSWEYMSSHDRVFINRKGKIQSILLGGSQRIGWTMFFTEKHMVKNSHRFCGGLRGGQQGEAQRKIHLLNALGEYLRYN